MKIVAGFDARMASGRAHAMIGHLGDTEVALKLPQGRSSARA
jgi:hypothetical protein